MSRFTGDEFETAFKEVYPEFKSSDESENCKKFLKFFLINTPEYVNTGISLTLDKNKGEMDKCLNTIIGNTSIDELMRFIDNDIISQPSSQTPFFLVKSKMLQNKEQSAPASARPLASALPSARPPASALPSARPPASALPSARPPASTIAKLAKPRSARHSAKPLIATASALPSALPSARPSAHHEANLNEKHPVAASVEPGSAHRTSSILDDGRGGSRRRRSSHRKRKSYRKSKRVRHTRRKQTRRHRHRRSRHRR